MIDKAALKTLLIAYAKRGPDADQLFHQIVDMLWGKHNRIEKFEWNPWNCRMSKAAHEHNYVFFSGCAASGKSRLGAVYAIVNWLCKPLDTIIMVTTTGLKDSNRRIWGAIERYWIAVEGAFDGIGRMVGSLYEIYTVDKNNNKMGMSGLSMIAAERKNEKECLTKVLGAHAPRVFYIIDEMPELSPNIPISAKGNMESNPFFQMLGFGNFKSREDVFGQMIKPKAGWDSINLDSEEWDTEDGICLRFDGMKSPNVLAGEDLYKGIYSIKTLMNHRKLGENSPEFWRMCRSFGSSIGLDDRLYSDADFSQGKAMFIPGRDCLWQERRFKWSFMDPAFTNDGDRCIQVFGWFGIMNDRPTISFEKYVTIRDNALLEIPKTRQTAEAFRDNCLAEGVRPEHAGLDATGPGGIAIADYVTDVWTTKILRVNFSGNASERWVGAEDPRKCIDAYDRRVSELWGYGLELMKYGQIKGITEELARELKARKRELIKGPMGLKTKVQTKKEMKLDLLFSPDLADAWVGGIELCRERMGLVAGGKGSHYAKANEIWKERFKKANSIYANSDRALAAKY